MVQHGPVQTMGWTRGALLPLLLLCFGCPERGGGADQGPVPRPDLVAPLQVVDGQGLLFSFYDNRAEMRTVESVAEVAQTARAYVMVTHPSRRLPGDLVYVTDLSQKKKGKYRVWVEPKGDWLDRVVPKVSLSKALARNEQPPAPKKRRPRRRRRRRRRPAPKAEPQAKAPDKATATAPQILLFSTNWCPSCRAARDFFKQQGVAFKELDVERDPQAQQLYLALQQRFGLRKGVIPVIVVGERVFQGFSKPQIKAALAASAQGG